jgi:hypothetical protein
MWRAAGDTGKSGHAHTGDQENHAWKITLGTRRAVSCTKLLQRGLMRSPCVVDGNSNSHVKPMRLGPLIACMKTNPTSTTQSRQIAQCCSVCHHLLIDHFLALPAASISPLCSSHCYRTWLRPSDTSRASGNSHPGFLPTLRSDLCSAAPQRHGRWQNNRRSSLRRCLIYKGAANCRTGGCKNSPGPLVLHTIVDRLLSVSVNIQPIPLQHYVKMMPFPAASSRVVLERVTAAFRGHPYWSPTTPRLRKKLS